MKIKFTTNIDKELLKKIKVIAVEKDLNVNDIIEEQLKKYLEEEEEMKNLFNMYKEWRKVSEEMLEDGFNGTIDCGEQSVREDFSNYAELDEEISFEEMFELEREYEGW